MSYDKQKEIPDAKAPYRFVPLDDKIVSPYWKKAVSHDIPFADGVCGTFEVEITAYSDIFVSNGKKKDEDTQTPLEFSNLAGRYFIPATSHKGMIRNVTEIMSFGGMKPTVDNKKYAFRDLHNYKDYISNFKPAKIHAGYLRKASDGSFKIRDCGIPGRISQRDIDAKFHTDMARAFDHRGRCSSQKSAAFKFEEYSKVAGNFHGFNFYFEEIPRSKAKGRKVCEFDSESNQKGKIIFTGQPSENNLSSNRTNGKHYEFVFFEENCTDIPVAKSVIDDFKFAYFDGDATNESVDWKWRKEQLNDGKEIPVFFQKSKRKGVDTVKHLGLSYLYKLPYKNDIHATLSHTQKEDRIDLARLIFGYIDGKNTALKGRVNFSHAWLTNEVTPIDEKKEVLSTPRASYYPFYLQQEGTGDLLTYMNDSAKLAGWKRYPIHKTLKHNKNPENDKVCVKFRPLPEGAKFKFTVSYHNLKRAELGALLSALTFHNTEAAFHNIGMAKPLGYGKIKLKVTGIDVEEYLKDFEYFMNSELKTDWTETEQIKELIALCVVNETRDEELSYMPVKDYAGLKKGDVRLSKFREENPIEIKSVLSENDKVTLAKQSEADRLKLENAGSTAEVIHQFQKREESKFEEVFDKKKNLLIEQLHKLREEAKQKERDALNEKFAKEQAAKREKLGELTLCQYMEQKGSKNIKALKATMEGYGRIQTGAKNNKVLFAEYSDGFLTADEDLECLLNWLKARYAEGGNKVKKEMKKPFGKKHPFFKFVITWTGEAKAKELYSEILK